MTTIEAAINKYIANKNYGTFYTNVREVGQDINNVQVEVDYTFTINSNANFNSNTLSYTYNSSTIFINYNKRCFMDVTALLYQLVVTRIK